MTVASAGPGFSTTVEALRLREWQLGPGQPTLVMDQFSAEDFHLIVDDRADVHVSSKDGPFYLGWFPLGHPGTDGEEWKIAVTGTAQVRGYHLSFDTETPIVRGRHEPEEAPEDRQVLRSTVLHISPDALRWAQWGLADEPFHLGELPIAWQISARAEASSPLAQWSAYFTREVPGEAGADFLVALDASDRPTVPLAGAELVLDTVAAHGWFRDIDQPQAAATDPTFTSHISLGEVRPSSRTPTRTPWRPRPTRRDRPDGRHGPSPRSAHPACGRPPSPPASRTTSSPPSPPPSARPHRSCAGCCPRPPRSASCARRPSNVPLVSLNSPSPAPSQLGVPDFLASRVK
ncbi:hypothetical protein GCM10012280_58000 [Wenjunlia tyrosinilytica]|uniref:DUF317 domain-containing protein n=1 Tax=Wenjunlia tyrosinilytica TaxID=1544741 RepID=A0A917ZWM2_9ACTN|nr:hypothetical protein GCM10012280_58000 [Wenjunlia tyrosinilytica]